MNGVKNQFFLVESMVVYPPPTPPLHTITLLIFINGKYQSGRARKEFFSFNFFFMCHVLEPLHSGSGTSKNKINFLMDENPLKNLGI